MVLDVTTHRHFAGLGRLVIGWPDVENNRRRIRTEDDRTVGFVRHVHASPAGVRYFAERRDVSPIEGTFRTLNEALRALVSDVRAEGGIVR